MKPNQKDQQKIQRQGYEQQNNILKQMYFQRLKAKQQLEKQRNIDEQPIIMKPSMKKAQQIEQLHEQSKQQKQSQKQPIQHNLLLNTLFFDTRQKKPNFFVKIFAFFNQNVEKPQKLVSDSLQSVFISTYGFETQTFQRILDQNKIKLVILNDSSQTVNNKVIKQYGGYKNLTVIMKGKTDSTKYGVFHTKLWLLKFKKFLRVVICTSNQHTMDWAVWQNAYWYQDFQQKDPKQIKDSSDPPKKSQPLFNQPQQPFNMCQNFQQTLTQVVQSMLPSSQLEQLTGISLSNYKFEEIKVILLPSIAGRHYGAQMKSQGIVKLKEVMKTFNKIQEPVVTYNSTSLGVLQGAFVQDVFCGFCPREKKLDISRFRLIYPTRRYIQQQTGGQAQVLFLTSQNYKKSDLGKKILYRYQSNQNNPILGGIPHLKLVLIQPRKQDSQQKCIMYVGSHNMTKAAWGKLQKKQTQLYVANSQLGILFFDVDLKWFKKWSPFKYPPTPYKENDQPFLRDFFR